MSTFAPVREARRLWERTAPQLTLDLDALEGGTSPRSSWGSPVANGVPPSNAPETTNGSGRNHLDGGRAAGATGG
jgi:hypothetical protein